MSDGLPLLVVMAEVEFSVPLLIALALLSVLIGILSGMVGMSLCVMRLPLMLAFGIDPLITAGTNLAVGVLSGMTGTWPHYRAGRVVLWMVVFMGVPSVAGAYVGGHFSEEAPTWLLLGLVALFLAVSGGSMLWGALRSGAKAGESSDDTAEQGSSTERSRLIAGGVVGLAIGLVGGAAGAILGTVRVPALVTILKMQPAKAVGTATVLGILAGLSGFAGHLLHGHIDWPLLGLLGGTAMVGTFTGARLVGWLNPRHLRLLVGVVVFVMAPVILYEAIGEFSG